VRSQVDDQPRRPPRGPPPTDPRTLRGSRSRRTRIQVRGHAQAGGRPRRRSFRATGGAPRRRVPVVERVGASATSSAIYCHDLHARLVLAFTTRAAKLM